MVCIIHRYASPAGWIASYQLRYWLRTREFVGRHRASDEACTPEVADDPDRRDVHRVLHEPRLVRPDRRLVRRTRAPQAPVARGRRADPVPALVPALRHVLYHGDG